MSMVGTATPTSMATWLVHLPVPFWPALSRMTSTRGLPVSGSVRARHSTVISMRYPPSSPPFQLAKVLLASPADMRQMSVRMWYTSAIDCMMPYSMPLWTILTKWPAPRGPM